MVFANAGFAARSSIGERQVSPAPTTRCVLKCLDGCLARCIYHLHIRIVDAVLAKE